MTDEEKFDRGWANYTLEMLYIKWKIKTKEDEKLILGRLYNILHWQSDESEGSTNYWNSDESDWQSDEREGSNSSEEETPASWMNKKWKQWKQGIRC